MHEIDLDLYDEWKNRYFLAEERTAHARTRNKGILIEVAAQHPLVEGKYPNEEFRARLDTAIEVYKDELSKNNPVKIYVPGSIHMSDGISDTVSLSKAGKEYLLDKSISEGDIFGEEINYKYKGNSGVYNSSDECYVSCKLFDDLKYASIICICSSPQMMRKALSYIFFGYIPKMHTVSCEHMYHNYVDEAFKYIPILLKDRNGLQNPDSEIAKLIRDARKPE